MKHSWCCRCCAWRHTLSCGQFAITRSRWEACVTYSLSHVSVPLPQSDMDALEAAHSPWDLPLPIAGSIRRSTHPVRRCCCHCFHKHVAGSALHLRDVTFPCWRHVTITSFCLEYLDHCIHKQNAGCASRIWFPTTPCWQHMMIQSSALEALIF